MDDPAEARRLAAREPVQFLATDVLWLDGLSTVDLPYASRRELLGELGVTGEHWQTSPHFPGGGAFALEAATAQGTPGVIAKRLDSCYLPGRRSREWLRIRAAKRR